MTSKRILSFPQTCIPFWSWLLILSISVHQLGEGKVKKDAEIEEVRIIGLVEKKKETLQNVYSVFFQGRDRF